MKKLILAILLMSFVKLIGQEKLSNFKSHLTGFNIDTGIESIHFFDTFQNEIILAPNKNLYKSVDNKIVLKLPKIVTSIFFLTLHQMTSLSKKNKHLTIIS